MPLNLPKTLQHTQNHQDAANETSPNPANCLKLRPQFLNQYEAHISVLYPQPKCHVFNPQTTRNSSD